MIARYAVVVHTISKRTAKRIASQTLDAQDKDDARLLADTLSHVENVLYSRETEVVLKFPTSKGWVTLPLESIREVIDDLEEAINDA